MQKHQVHRRHVSPELRQTSEAWVKHLYAHCSGQVFQVQAISAPSDIRSDCMRQVKSVPDGMSIVPGEFVNLSLDYAQ
jgi:hypothetical protein